MKDIRFISKDVCRTFILISLIFSCYTVNAQHVAKALPTGGSFGKYTGYYVSLPADYATSGKKYPLIISIHGVGELAGAGATTLTNVVLNNGVPRVIKDGKFPASFNVKGQDFSFIVVTPQYKQWPGPQDVYPLLDYLKENYRVDESRCYLTGLSMGGGVTWTTISGIVEKAKGFAGAVVVCGAYYDATKQPQLAVNVASTNMPVWATHNEGDGTVTVENSKRWVRDINAVQPAPNPLAKLTIFPVSGHDAWSKTSDPNFKEDGLNMYEWLLQYYRRPDGTIAFTEEQGETEPKPPPPTGNKRINVPVTSGNRMYYDDVMANLNVTPGDTLCIPAGDYDYIRFAKIAGTAEKPVIIKNCGGLVRVGVNSTTTIAAFILSNCKYFKIEGDGAPGLTYGFDINGTNQNGIKMYGFIFSAGSTDFEVHHAYVHDASMFVQAKTLQNCDHPEWLDGQFTMKNVKIHDLLCRRAAWEGFYIGNSHYLWNAGTCTDMKSHLVENLHVYNNDLEGMGWDGIQIALATNGDNRVYNNRIHNYGLARNSAQGYGILNGGGSSLRIYNNYVSKGYNAGIEIFGSGISHVYNNVVTDIEYEGINVADKLLFEPATAYIYNNTVYNTGKNGIKVYADLTTVGHKLYNNIVVAEGTQWDYPQQGYYVKGTNTILFDHDKNLSFKDVASAGFMNPEGGNFHLKQGSSAIDAGRNMSDLGLVIDFDGKARPGSGGYDAGAFEYDGTANVPPVAAAGNDVVLTPPANNVTLDGSSSLDTDGSIAGYAWSKISGPAQGTVSQGNTARPAISGLVAGSYVFELKVTDNNGLTGTDRVTVSVLSAPNQQPVLSLGNDITVTLPSSSTVLSSSNSYDPDGLIVKYEWKKVSGPESGTIDLASSSVTGVNGLTEGIYIYELTVTDDGGGTSSGRVTVTVQGAGAVNKNPVARAGTDIAITLPESEVELDGSASDDPDGSIATFAWRKVSGPAASIASAASAKTAVTGLVAGEYIFELKVTDNKGATATDEIKVTVTGAANKPPMANAGPDITIDLPVSSVTLDASASSDEDGTITGYAWRKVSGPAATIASAAAAKTNVTGLVEGVYEFEVKVTDNSGATATNAVKVTVLRAANQAPIADAGKNVTINLPDNTVQLDGSGSHDPDGDIVAYAWKKLSGPAGGAITNAASAATTVTGLQAGVYIYELTVKDERDGAATRQVTITVLDVSNTTPVANAGADQTITWPVSSVTLNGSASTDADGKITTYLWERISGPSNVQFSAANAAVNVVSGMEEGIYVFQLTVTDDRNGTHSDRINVTVKPEPPVENLPPVAIVNGPSVIELPTDYVQVDGSESHGIDKDLTAYTWTQVSGPATSTIVNPSQMSTHIINMSTAGNYEFELTVKDEAGLTNATRYSVTVLESKATGDSIKIYPTPATSYFYVELNTTLHDSNLMLFLYDLNGKMVKQMRLPEGGSIRQQVDISGLPKGYFVVEVKGDNGRRWTGKVIKM